MLLPNNTSRCRPSVSSYWFLLCIQLFLRKRFTIVFQILDQTILKVIFGEDMDIFREEAGSQCRCSVSASIYSVVTRCRSAVEQYHQDADVSASSKHKRLVNGSLCIYDYKKKQNSHQAKNESLRKLAFFVRTSQFGGETHEEIRSSTKSRCRSFKHSRLMRMCRKMARYDIKRVYF